jgi:hypothetical protein
MASIRRKVRRFLVGNGRAVRFSDEFAHVELVDRDAAAPRRNHAALRE